MLSNARREWCWVVLLVVPALMMPMSAQADESQAAADPSSSESATDDILAGPKVDAQSMDDGVGVTRDLAMRDAVEIPFRRWSALLRELDLTAAQRRDVQRIIQPLQRRQREWARTHGKELRELMAAIRAARENGTFDPTLIEQRDTLRSSAPKTDEAQQAIWDLLTKDQQTDMQERLQALRDQMQQRVRDMVDGDAAKEPNTSSKMNVEQRGTHGDLDARARRRLEFLRRHLSRRHRETRD
jgi:hypothetical protein